MAFADAPFGMDHAVGPEFEVGAFGGCSEPCESLT